MGNAIKRHISNEAGSVDYDQTARKGRLIAIFFVRILRRHLFQRCAFYEPRRQTIYRTF